MSHFHLRLVRRCYLNSLRSAARINCKNLDEMHALSKVTGETTMSCKLLAGWKVNDRTQCCVPCCWQDRVSRKCRLSRICVFGRHLNRKHNRHHDENGVTIESLCTLLHFHAYEALFQHLYLDIGVHTVCATHCRIY